MQGDSLLVQLLKPTSFSPVLAFIGILLYMCKSEKKKGVGTILIGFAVLMTGMTTMSNAVLPLQNEAWFTSLFTRFSNPLLVSGGRTGHRHHPELQRQRGHPAGAERHRCHHLRQCHPHHHGSEHRYLCDCTVVLGGCQQERPPGCHGAPVLQHYRCDHLSVRVLRAQRRLPLCLCEYHHRGWGIAIVHSVFNILATVILLPFATGLEKLAILTIPDSPEKEEFALLDDRLLNTPAVAVERARAATAEMAELARVGVVQAMSLTHEWNDELAQKVRDEECRVDRYEDALGTYLVKLSGRELNHTDSQSVNTLLHTISDFERISDHSVNLLESAEEMHQKEIHFSKDAQEELQVLEDAVQDTLSRTTDAFRKGDLHLASKVEPLEAVVNELVRAIKARHVARLQAGSCSIEYGFVLDDLLTNYERVCDHCSNVAVAQIEVAQDSFDTHAYLNDLRHGNDTKESEEFHRRLGRYRERYLFPDGQTAEEN